MTIYSSERDSSIYDYCYDGSYSNYYGGWLRGRHSARAQAKYYQGNDYDYDEDYFCDEF